MLILWNSGTQNHQIDLGTSIPCRTTIICGHRGIDKRIWNDGQEPLNLVLFVGSFQKQNNYSGRT